MMPAWNILPTEMLTQEPAMTLGTLGRDDGADHRGSSRNCNREVVVVAVLHHGGISILPREHTSAMAVPEMPAKTMDATMFTSARLPVKWPKKALQKFRMRRVMPPAVHQSTSQHESGDAQQGERVDACIEFLCQDRHVHIGGQQVEQRRSTQRERNGHVQQQQDQKTE